MTALDTTAAMNMWSRGSRVSQNAQGDSTSEKFTRSVKSGVCPTCLATVFSSSSTELWKLESPASYKLVGKFFLAS